MRRLPPISALRAFEAAARTGSFKDAAGELNVTPPAISHQVKSLEDHTVLVLFDVACMAFGRRETMAFFTM